MDMIGSELEDLPQSQLDQLLLEWTSLNQSLICSDECNQQNGDSNSSAEGQIDNDFQKIFLKAVFGDNFLKISKNTPEKTARIPDDNTLRDSQIIDIEEVVPTFLLNSQKKRVDASHEIDFETFLENKANIISIKCNNNQSKESNKNKNMQNMWYNDPMPLLIEDILSIASTEEFYDTHSLYGQHFKKVMFYGRITQLPGAAKDERDIRSYSVDDGTGSITVRYAHNCTRLQAVIKGVERLKYNYQIALKEGIPFLGEENYRPNTPVCRDLLDKVGILINVINRNIAEAQKYFATGNKVYVAGTPYFDRATKKIRIFAFDMLEDARPNRDTEINFKKRLISLYETRYLKYSKDGNLLSQN